jgi:predicted MPP superfamily phosphohydrolase
MRSFFLIIFAVIFFSNLISGMAVDSLLHRVDAGAGWEWGFAAFFIFQNLGFASVIVARLLGYQPGTGLGRPLLSLFMIWNLLFSLPAVVVYLVWAILGWVMLDTGGARQPHLEQQLPTLIGLSLLPGMALLATVVAMGQLQRFRINRMELAIPGLPTALAGLSIVHLSDLHIGKLTRGKVLDRMVEETNKLAPDLILVTGDLINMSLEDLPEGLEVLRSLKARHGLFLCEGNHDLIESRAGFEAATKASGLPFLLNESATVSVNGQPIQVLGLRWGEGMRLETTGEVAEGALHRLLAQREPGDFTILLAHHPDAFDAAADAGIPLVLAGHTHGGQLMLTRRIGFGPWLYRYWSGLYVKGASRMVVSNGAGNWFPLRINAPAEIIHLVLKSA